MNAKTTLYINAVYVNFLFVSIIKCCNGNLKKSILVVAWMLFDIKINIISNKITARAINPICSGETRLANINVVNTGISLTRASLKPNSIIFLNNTFSRHVKSAAYKLYAFKKCTPINVTASLKQQYYCPICQMFIIFILN